MFSLNASSESFDEARKLFAETYSLPSVTLTPSEAEFTWSHRARGDSTMTFRATRIMATIESPVGGGDEFVVQWSRGGTLTFDPYQSAIQIPQKIPFVLPNGRSTTLARGTDLDLNLVHIDKQFVRNIAAELDDVHFVTFTIAPPESALALRLWRSAVDLVSTVVLDPSYTSSTLLQREMSRLISVSMLNTFPYESVARAPGPVGIEPVAVRLAIEFVHNNAHLPIGPLEIARAVHLSTRSLQHALRRYRDTTPSALLQSVRLERVHSQLQVSDSRLETVTAVARSWGFVHLGRFASVYRARYGVSPNETLRAVAPCRVAGSGP